MKSLILSMILALAALTPTIAMAGNEDMGVDAKGQQTSVKVVSTGIELSVAPTAEKAARFEVFGITGQLVTAVNVDKGETRTLDIRKGYYIVRTTSADGKTTSKRYTVQ